MNIEERVRENITRYLSEHGLAASEYAQLKTRSKGPDWNIHIVHDSPDWPMLESFLSAIVRDEDIIKEIGDITSRHCKEYALRDFNRGFEWAANPYIQEIHKAIQATISPYYTIGSLAEWMGCEHNKKRLGQYYLL